ncbi:MAG TPA: hypothetical protein PKX12_13950 [Spirochaetota bacterium]|nr:hypothetical protein [Spirochaetota bacterium]
MMENLQELTGQESGIVIYRGDGGVPETVVCNWSHIQGFPRVAPGGLGIIGFGEEIPETEGEHRDDIPAMIEETEIVYANGEDMPQAGTVYEMDDFNITIIAPDDWN